MLRRFGGATCGIQPTADGERCGFNGEVCTLVFFAMFFFSLCHMCCLKAMNFYLCSIYLDFHVTEQIPR
jgi:hypothetical protein